MQQEPYTEEQRRAFRYFMLKLETVAHPEHFKPLPNGWSYREDAERKRVRFLAEMGEDAETLTTAIVLVSKNGEASEWGILVLDQETGDIRVETKGEGD